MVCEFINSCPIITINLVKRTSTFKYAFVGNIQDKTIYNKIEKKTNLSSKEIAFLNTLYGKSVYTNWLTGNIKFIYDKIYLNDTVHILRYKICHYIGTYSYKITPNNQHLWYKRNDGVYKQFGIVYKKQHLFKDQLKAGKPKLDKFFYTNVNGVVKKKNIDVLT